MNIEQSYWDSLQECREMIAALILRTEQWVQQQPEIQRLLKRICCKGRPVVLLG